MTEETVQQWGIVELMGHKVVAGKISKSEMFGAPLLRVDIPATKRFPEFTQFYNNNALYCVTPVSEEVARRAAEECETNPVSVYVPTLISPAKFEEVQAERDQYMNDYFNLRNRLPANSL